MTVAPPWAGSWSPPSSTSLNDGMTAATRSSSGPSNAATRCPMRSSAGCSSRRANSGVTTSSISAEIAAQWAVFAGSPS